MEAAPHQRREEAVQEQGTVSEINAERGGRWNKMKDAKSIRISSTYTHPQDEVNPILLLGPCWACSCRSGRISGVVVRRFGRSEALDGLFEKGSSAERAKEQGSSTNMPGQLGKGREKGREKWVWISP